MSDGLIGYTGFVGGNLARQHGFDESFNSKNIESIAGREFELLVCAGAPAEKWKANREPESDRAAIQRLATCVGKAKAEYLILISSVDVYPRPVEVDEDEFIVPVDPAYGRHRLLLEKYLQDHFDSLIVRLPGLFGDGLKKNIIYDFLHGNRVDQVHADASFQFYGLDTLWRDIGTARAAGLRLINFATEPVTVAAVAREAFAMEFGNRPEGVTPARYDFRSRHAALYGGKNGYLQDRAAVLSNLRDFVQRHKSAISQPNPGLQTPDPNL